LLPPAVALGLVLGLVLVALACESSALAQPARPALEVGVDLDRCPALPRAEILRLAALELGVRVVDAAAGTAGQATRVQVACSGAAVDLVVTDSITGKELLRRMEVASTEPHVAVRLVALGAAELVLTSWLELTLARGEAAPRPPGEGHLAAELRRAAEEAALRRAPRTAGTGYVLVVGQAIGPFRGAGLGWGGGLRLGWAAGTAAPGDGGFGFRPAADLELTTARADTDTTLGTIRATLWSLALRASLRAHRGRMWFDLGGGGRFGLARLEGQPVDPASVRGGTVAGTWAGPVAYAGIGVRARRLAAAAGVEVGHVLRTVSGASDDGSGISIAGPWVSASLALGWGGP
jgi:hypothetical protein